MRKVMGEEGVRTYRGSCHCGAVRFEADIDFSSATTGRCNCSICWKTGWWGLRISPAAFRLISGADALVPYIDRPELQHRHCRTCGIEPFAHGNMEWAGGEFYSVNVRCLDDVDLSGVRVRYFDGRHDTWDVLDERPWVDPFPGAGKKPAVTA